MPSLTRARQDSILYRVREMGVRDIRQCFSQIRAHLPQHKTIADTLLPKYGITIGQFAVAYVLNMPSRVSRSQAT